MSSNQQLPILPVRFQTSTFGVYELNYCVRYGNRWNLIAIVTEYRDIIAEISFAVKQKIYFAAKKAFNLSTELLMTKSSGKSVAASRSMTL